MSRSGREILLASRPVGEPTEENFTLVEREVPEPGEGEVLVRNLVMSVDPYMRGRMNDAASYVAPFRIGEPLDGGAVGEVIASRDPNVPEGTLVSHWLGWREFTLVSGNAVQKIDPTLAPPSAYLGVLGMPGITAYVGLLDIAAMKEGDVVFVSGAAGMVGSVVGQIAKLRGAAKVIGSAGSDTKVAYIKDELGFDAGFNYKAGPVRDQLKEAAPDGIDVYFDNVGGDHLEAALGAMRDFGRIAVCGMISQYNATEPPPGPRNFPLVLRRRLTVRGFIVSDHYNQFGDFLRDVGGWVAAGKISFRETYLDGIENAPKAFLGLLQGENVGKMLVRLSG